MTIADVINQHWTDIILLALVFVVFWGFKK